MSLRLDHLSSKLFTDSVHASGVTSLGLKDKKNISTRSLPSEGGSCSLVIVLFRKDFRI